MPRTARSAPLSRSLSRRLPALVAAGALGLTLGACGSVEEKAVETAIKKSNPSVKDVDVDKDGGFSIDSEDGTLAMGSKASLPDDFPKDVPEPKDATITTAATQGDEIAVMYTVKKGGGDPDGERDRLVSELESGGWTVEAPTTMDLEGMSSFSITGVKDGRAVSITYVQADGEDGQFMYSVKPEA